MRSDVRQALIEVVGAYGDDSLTAEVLTRVERLVDSRDDYVDAVVQVARTVMERRLAEASARLEALAVARLLPASSIVH